MNVFNKSLSNSKLLILSKERDSNIELLRIVSMLLVMVVHADYLALGAPSVADISSSYASSFVRAYIEALSCICVNVFIIISGWFGIRFRLVRLAEFIFQVIFISIVLYTFMRIILHVEAMTIMDWVRLLFLKSQSYWFVKAYLILYIFAPILNAFVDNGSRSQLKMFLISFYLLQSIYGFYASNVWFSEGYSPLSFIGLYLLARYMRLYSNRCMRFKRNTDMALYMFLSFFTAVCALTLTPLFEKGSSLMFLYSSPLVIMASIYFFLFFSKLSFNNKFVNWVSISAFAAYLVHCSSYVFEPFYLKIIKDWYDKSPLYLFFLITMGLVISLFCLSIFLDKLRLRVWRFLLNLWYH